MNSKQLHDLALPGETPVQTLARVHHEAYLVEAVGFRASGLSAGRYMLLVRTGVLKASTPADPPKGNPYDLVLRAAEDFAGMTNKQRARAKTWSADTWRNRLASHDVPPLTTDGGHETIVLPGGLPEKRWGHKPVEDLQHEAAALFHGTPVPSSNTGLTGYQKDAYAQAISRAGMYCKRLGETVAQDLDDVLGEDALAGRLKQLRSTIGKAIQQGWTKEQLAGKLQEVGGWARDWQRVAETELQGAYNDAAVLAAVAQQGIHAQVARIPETTACVDCKRLFLRDGKPIVFSVITLVKNGTNVDVPRAQWKATVWPIHPRCRCGCVPVPPGYSVDRAGNVTPSGVF